MEKNSNSAEITVTFRHTEPTAALKQHAMDKLAHCLSRYGVNDGTAHVILSVEKRDHSAEVNLHSKNFTVTTKATTEDLYSAIDRAADTVDGQLRKQKDKFLSQKHQGEKNVEP